MLREENEGMKRYEVLIIGAGPSGLSAAIEAAKRGLRVIVFDENEKPGGQLFKQIHKFFGSKEHHAKIRGYKIGQELLKEADEAGVEVVLNATVIGLYGDKEVTVKIKDGVRHYKGDTIIVATGAAENMVTFPGWTLPGVIGAGATQTMMNLHGIQPGKKILMLGSGNVGLVVSFQLLQAGCEVVALVDAAPRVGGYGVHASKVARCGVPFYLSHTITKAHGEECVTGVTISQVDNHFQPVEGTEKYFDVDTICLAVGLSPMSQLLKMAGCAMEDNPKRGGQVPIVDEYGQTSLDGVFAVGDVAGIEEASSAMIEGRMAGVHPVLECTQNIPCNPCQDACPKGCISTGSNITNLPFVDESKTCVNCGMCVASCSGQAIFLINEDCNDGSAQITIPYEFLPLPKVGTSGIGLSRNGQEICSAEVVDVKSMKAFDNTNLLTIKVEKENAMKVRFFKPCQEVSA